jgi:hypothetical protein
MRLQSFPALLVLAFVLFCAVKAYQAAQQVSVIITEVAK